MHGVWARGGLRAVMSSFGTKFEWFCGKLPGAEKDERRRACGKVVSHVVFVGLGCAVWAWFGLRDGGGSRSTRGTPF